MNWHMHEVLDLPQGRPRRDMIVALLQSGNHCLVVNCRYRPQLHEDNDLQYLIKKGILKAVRKSNGGSSRRTYLVLIKEK